jgi:lipopolysaccharide biosynthesis regulator YciM
VKTVAMYSQKKYYPKQLVAVQHVMYGRNNIVKRKMRYRCKECNFKWEGTSYTFEQVREHEKTHPVKSK